MLITKFGMSIQRHQSIVVQSITAYALNSHII